MLTLEARFGQTSLTFMILMISDIENAYEIIGSDKTLKHTKRKQIAHIKAYSFLFDCFEVGLA